MRSFGALFEHIPDGFGLSPRDRFCRLVRQWSRLVMAILKVLLQRIGVTDRDSASQLKFLSIFEGVKASADRESILSKIDVRGLQHQS